MNRMNSTHLVVEPTADIYARAVLHDVEHGLRKVYDTDGTHLRALAQMVERLQSAVEFERASAADANAQLNAMRKDRDRHKAWCDSVMAQEPVAVCTVKAGDLMMIVRPQPLKEEE